MRFCRLAIIVFVALPAVAQNTPALASMDGTVFGADRQPLSGARVWFQDQHTSAAISDTFGKFEFQNIAPGEYHLVASHDGYVYLAVSAPVHVAAAQHMTGVVVTMAPLAVLSGKVTDENGDPLPGVTARSVQRHQVVNGRLLMDGDNGSEVETDAKGEYRIMVEPGRWYLRFSPQKTNTDGQAHVTTYYPGVRESAEAAAFDVTAGQQMPELNVRLRKIPVYHVRGRVAGSATKKLRVGAIQQAEGSADTNDQGQMVQEDGTFDIAGLAPGAWRLLVAPVPEPGIFDFAFPVNGTTVEIMNKDVENVVVEAFPNIDISGSVKTVPEQAAPSSPKDGNKAEVRLEPLYPTDFTIGVPVQSDGTFTLEKVAAGSYRVEFNAPPGGFVKSVMFGGKECIDSGIEVKGVPAPGGLQILFSMTAGQIVGSVTNPDGAAPSVSTVTLVPDGPVASVYRPELNLNVKTDAGGQFVIKNVVPGTYRIYAWEHLEPIAETGPLNESIAFADPDFPRRFDDMSAVVTVDESESKRVSLTQISVAKMEIESRRR